MHLLQTVLLASLLFVLGVGTATFFFSRQIKLEPVAEQTRVESESLSLTALNPVPSLSTPPKDTEETDAAQVVQQTTKTAGIERSLR